MRALLSALLLLALPAVADDPDYAALRADLVDEVQAYAGYAGDASFSDEVLATLGRVERHRFVPPGQVAFAYENRPLPIGHGQTISQPYIVALMTELVEPDKDDVVLEIGTGSGYQAAVLAELVDQVYSIEIIEALASSARERLQRLGYDNVTTRLGDGYYGWKAQAPFDAIIVTAAACRHRSSSS